METPPPEDKSRFLDLRNAALTDLRSKSWELTGGEVITAAAVTTRLNFLRTSDFDFKKTFAAAQSDTPIAYTDILLGQDGVEYKINSLNNNLKEEESTVINVYTVKERDEFGPIINKEFYSFEHQPNSDILTVYLLSSDKRTPNPQKWVFRSN